jgi:6-phosphogluconolactonase
MTHLTRALLPLLLALLSPVAQAADYYVFFGTHRAGKSLGFSISHFDSDTGALTKPVFALETPAPAYFIIHPDRKHIYSCNSGSLPAFAPSGGVSAYAFDPATAKMTAINTVASAGGDPSYIAFDTNYKHLLVANYQGGTFAVFTINPDFSVGARTALITDTGHSVDPARQKQAYAHSLRLDPTGQFAIAADLGLDKVFVFHYDNNAGTLTPSDGSPVSTPPGLGPRHTVFHPNGKWLYLVTEMGGKILQFNWDAAKGTLTQQQIISATPADNNIANASAEIGIHPGGKFLYVTDRGPNLIGVFAIDPQNGNLTLIEHVATQGKTPRNFAFDPTGHWLLVTNHDSNNAVVFRIDSDTGKLTPAGEPVAVQYPFCPRFLAVNP